MVIFRRKLKPKQVERTFQKNRFFNKLKELKLKVGSAALICSKESRMELSQIKRIKHCLKRLVKKRRRGKSKVKRGARSIRKKI
jgi:hypothetical protein